METEDAWEIASRRASIISRRPSNHSTRLPPTTDSPAPPGADAVAGRPSTGTGFGASSASVDELLAGESGTSEEGGMSAFARQTTAVQDPSARNVSDVEMPEALHEEDEPTTVFGEDPNLSGSLAILAHPSALDRQGHTQGNGRAIPVPLGLGLSASAIDPTLTGSLSETQTPMNDTFLSTLALGVHQRLDLARQMDEVGRGNETVAEETEGEGECEGECEGGARGGDGQIQRSGSPSVSASAVGQRRSLDDGWMEVEREAEGGRGGDGDERPEIDMMFT